MCVFDIAAGGLQGSGFPEAGLEHDQSCTSRLWNHQMSWKTDPFTSASLCHLCLPQRCDAWVRQAPPKPLKTPSLNTMSLEGGRAKWWHTILDFTNSRNLWNLISMWIPYTLMIERGSVICKKRISEVPAVGKCLTLKTPIFLFTSTLGPRRVPVDCKPRMGNGGREFTFMGLLLWLGGFPTQFNSHNSHVEKV